MAYSNPTLQTPLITGAGGLVRQFVLSTTGSTSFVASPAALATITWLQVPQDGEYSVQLQYGLTGQGQTFRLNNIRLPIDSTAITSLILLSSATVHAATVILKVTSGNWIALNVISADPGLIYHGSILPTRMS